MKNRITQDSITKLKKNEIFVFGSNALGQHSGGAAKLAKEKFKAKEGIGRGITGQCYAIDTMGGFEVIKEQIEPFFSVAKVMQDKIFLVTELGCGIAGYTPEQIAPLFKDAKNIENIYLPAKFWEILEKQNIVRGYKVFNPDMTCKDFQYKVGKDYKLNGKLEICKTGSRPE